MTESADTLIPPATRPVDWHSVAAVLEGFGAARAGRSGRTRFWHVPSPRGGPRRRGYFQVEVTLRPRWCAIAVDRWHTTDRVAEPSEAWFTEHVWPHVQQAVKTRGGCGFLPSGGGAFAWASPLDRAVLLDVLTAWVAEELTWGVSRDEMGWAAP
jgi:hypothetical protein